MPRSWVPGARVDTFMFGVRFARSAAFRLSSGHGERDLGVRETSFPVSPAASDGRPRVGCQERTRSARMTAFGRETCLWETTGGGFHAAIDHRHEPLRSALSDGTGNTNAGGRAPLSYRLS
jgi:hypothetical protein